MLNTSLNTPVRLTHEGRDLTFSGIVVREEHREHYVKLLINIDEAQINNRIINYNPKNNTVYLLRNDAPI